MSLKGCLVVACLVGEGQEQHKSLSMHLGDLSLKGKREDGGVYAKLGVDSSAEKEDATGRVVQTEL